jgi:hypothetical protein
MTTSTFPATGGFVDNTSAAKFIPEIWSDEIIAAYKTNLVLAPLVRRVILFISPLLPVVWLQLK